MRKKHPNLIIVMPDELRQQAVGVTKSDPVITPNIDKFASESLSLTNALSNCPICSPARAMLFTGKYPISNGVIDNCYSAVAEYGIELKESEICLSDVLHDAGYSQGYIGKYHLDLPKVEEAQYTEGWRGNPDKGGTLWDAYTPLGKRRHGFDFWYSYGCCDKHLSPHYWKNKAGVSERTDVSEWSVKHETDVAIDYIKNKNDAYRDKAKPFFLMVSHNPPHMPFHDVPEQYKSLYSGKSPSDLLNRPDADATTAALKSVVNYFAAITGIDEHFGRLLKSLEEEGIEEDTIVIFMSDHGELMGSHQRMGKNAWQNEALLIPFILRWKGNITPCSDDLFFNMPDIMPTLLSLMGLNRAIPEGVEGTDHSEFFLGNTANRPSSGFYLTAQPLFPEERRGIKTLKHTFVIIRAKDSGEISYVLHDNINDEYQLKNIADGNPELIKKYKKELLQWLLKTNDPWLQDKEISMVLEKGIWVKLQKVLISFSSKIFKFNK